MDAVGPEVVPEVRAAFLEPGEQPWLSDRPKL
jgi:hypothetical protein